MPTHHGRHPREVPVLLKPSRHPRESGDPAQLLTRKRKLDPRFRGDDVRKLQSCALPLTPPTSPA
ncbi:hypothetical protein HMF7854_13245 [Sphingomonas ginkgonis]|uniref:Uncharacterized protein n=1 Tax=Sphingomonas ginkgonis TaxID=2315330 RepID=A0A429VCK5_9SPHN|nr:hypothetical protein HMF7854_13245 [Sphingomonas ginkgonis]